MADEIMQKEDALVTVLMPVYKAQTSLLKRAVESILDQTYSNLEFLIIDDGAQRNCLDYLETITDPRITIIHNEANMGLAASLNRGIDAAKGDYIARMDSDDYSLPERIYEQVRYMNENPDVDVLACIAMDLQGDRLTGGIGGAYAHFDNEDMRIELSIGPKTFPHPAVMFRSSFLIKNNIRYDDTFRKAQDYDMWARCSYIGRLDSLQKVLLLYNIDEGRNDLISMEQQYYSDQAKLKCLERLIPNATEREKELYVRMKDVELTGTASENIDLVARLIESNVEKKIYDLKKYEEILYFWWARKMLYPVNRKHLAEFAGCRSYISKAAKAFVCRLPKHIDQEIYLRRVRRRSMKHLKVIGI